MGHIMTNSPIRTLPSGEQAAPRKKAKLLSTDKQERILEWRFPRSGNVNMDSNTTGPEATPPDKGCGFVWEFREVKTGS